MQASNELKRIENKTTDKSHVSGNFIVMFHISCRTYGSSSINFFITVVCEIWNYSNIWLKSTSTILSHTVIIWLWKRYAKSPAVNTASVLKSHLRLHHISWINIWVLRVPCRVVSKILIAIAEISLSHVNKIPPRPRSEKNNSSTKKVNAMLTDICTRKDMVELIDICAKSRSKYRGDIVNFNK